MVTKATAPFQQIKTLVRQKVDAGDWRPGDRIPSELDLAAQFGVARMTVNRALRELTEEGVLKRIAGVGTFVAEVKPQSNLLMIAHIRDEIRARGHEYRCRVLSQSREPASFDVAAAFGLAVNTPVFHVVCVHEENGRPIQLEDRYVNPAAAPEFIDQDFQAEPPSEYLFNNVSHYELEIEHVVDASLPTSEQARLLDMRADEPCLTLTRRTWTNGLPVTFVHFLHPGNRYRLGSRFKPGAGRHQT
ncbi:histidine utilization repressor [Burkholderia ambifaria]|uniref:Histidine utilization repressor n=1 Tax=Burkholderia ambifaria TaxID=152480 RepID=A0AA41E399_9BURK|nr:histidine utilization repressor [Burkholderia ambifaria]MBR8127589.1 histidine utilization repressor [Burkholderia ambifaria]PRE04943.1 histidine utilization repressor [Burkholderia ambifaria]